MFRMTNLFDPFNKWVGIGWVGSGYNPCVLNVNNRFSFSFAKTIIDQVRKQSGRNGKEDRWVRESSRVLWSVSSPSASSPSLSLTPTLAPTAIASVSPSSTPLSHHCPLSLQPSPPWSSLSAASTTESSPPLSDTSSSSSPPLLPSLLSRPRRRQPSPFPPPYSRLGPNPDRDSLLQFQQSLLPLLLALFPRAAFRHGIPKIPFLSFEDEVLSGVPMEALASTLVGEMLVEDVEIDQSPVPPERRRRLRFRRKPNLVQTQVRLLPYSSNVRIFQPETGSLVQPYLGPHGCWPLPDSPVDRGARPIGFDALCSVLGSAAGHY